MDERTSVSDPHVTPGQQWQHRNENIYRILLLTNEHSKQARYPVTVVYQNVANLTVWSRPLDDWHRSFKLLSEAPDE